MLFPKQPLYPHFCFLNHILFSLGTIITHMFDLWYWPPGPWDTFFSQWSFFFFKLGHFYWSIFKLTACFLCHFHFAYKPNWGIFYVICCIVTFRISVWFVLCWEFSLLSPLYFLYILEHGCIKYFKTLFWSLQIQGYFMFILWWSFLLQMVMFLSFFEIVNSMIYCRDYEFCHIPLKDIILREQLIWLSPYYKFSPATGTARISVQSL